MNLSRRMFVVVSLLALAVSACGGGRQNWMGQPVAAGGIQIQVSQAYVAGRRLYVRTTFMNQSQVPLTVNRDAVVAVLPNGRVVPRSSGTYTQHAPYVIPPGGMHEVYVDFMADGFQWHDFPGAQVNWSNAVTMNGAPVALPPTMLVAQ